MLSAALNIIFWFAGLIVLSYLLDRLWLHSLNRWVYIVFAAPGIIVHELSHYAACKLTGAQVSRVKLIGRDGGSVTHGPPRGGIFGQAFVSMAPFFGIPIMLLLVGLLFDKIDFFNCDLRWSNTFSGNVGDMVLSTFTSAWDLIVSNLWNHRSPWFLLYLYLAASLTTALAPSAQDIKNGAIGLIAMFMVMIIWAFVLDRFLTGWEAPVATFLMDLFGWIVAVGLIMCLFGLVLGLPFFLIKRAVR
ncbi:MAG: M50 family metallopeptidase [Candidatus Thermoplasmatota archaeon]|nr:M50 family metallopeptidase [Candidatus Thermoplasmatota archaeon]